MLLPHEMFANLYAEYGESFQKLLVGPAGELAKFWKSAKKHPALAGHPHLVNLSKTVPIGVHGDGVPITGKGKIWVRTAWVYSWSSLIAQAPTKEKQLFIGMVWDTLQGPNTMNVFLQILSWSLKHLQLGMWPLEDWQGKKQLVYTYCFLVNLLDACLNIILRHLVLFGPYFEFGTNQVCARKY